GPPSFEELEVLVTGRAPEGLLDVALEVLDDAVVVQERVVDIQEEYGPRLSGAHGSSLSSGDCSPAILGAPPRLPGADGHHNLSPGCEESSPRAGASARGLLRSIRWLAIRARRCSSSWESRNAHASCLSARPGLSGNCSWESPPTRRSRPVPG